MWAGVQRKLGLKSVGGFAVSQNSDGPQVAAYVPEGRGAPGFVGVWPLAQLRKNETPPPTARRSFFRVRVMHQAQYFHSASCTMQLAIAITEHGPGNRKVCWACVSRTLKYHRMYLMCLGCV